MMMMNDLSSYLQIWKKQTDQDKSNLSYLPLPPSHLFSRYIGKGGEGMIFHSNWERNNNFWSALAPFWLLVFRSSIFGWYIVVIPINVRW